LAHSIHADHVLLNVGVNPTPLIPDYYFDIFTTVIHVCPGSFPGVLRLLSEKEYILNIDVNQYNIDAYLVQLGLESSPFYLELAVQVGLSYPCLSIPRNAYLIGRVCDLHHLSNPLTGALNLLRKLPFRQLLFSSCPQYIPFFSHLAPCFYLPTDISLRFWMLKSDQANWIMRNTIIRLDGNLLSSFHPGRSYLFNKLINDFSDRFAFPEIKNLDRSAWLSVLRNTRIVIQHGLNGNAHPPFLTALSSGCLPFINRSSSRSLSMALDVNLAPVTYDTPEHLESLLLSIDYQQQPPLITSLSSSVHSVLLDNTVRWHQHLLYPDIGYSFNNRLDNCRFSQTPPFSIHNLYDQFVVLQAIQELLRRLSYFSKGCSPRLNLYIPLNSNSNIVRPDILYDLTSNIELLWQSQVNVVNRIDSEIAQSHVCLGHALSIVKKRLSLFPFAVSFDTEQSDLLENVKVSTLDLPQ
jgi:hypothetical protein